MVEPHDACRVGDRVAEPEREAQLHIGTGERLVHDVPPPPGVGDHLAVADRVAVKEDPVLGDLDVVEDHDRVHLVEA